MTILRYYIYGGKKEDGRPKPAFCPLSKNANDTYWKDGSVLLKKLSWVNFDNFCEVYFSDLSEKILNSGG